jgi:hypothetical protein
MGEFVVFFFVSLSAAFVGWGMMVAASRIKHQREERHPERQGNKDPGLSLPKPSEVTAPSPWPSSEPPSGAVTL